MTTTVTHVYDNYETAKDVVEDLEDAGFSSKEISLIGRKNDDTDDDGDGATTGATLGGVAGAGAGILAALGLIAIPGVGPLVAAGTLATALAGAAAGAVTGGLLGALIDYGLSEDDAHVYAESVRRGGTLVSVRADTSRAQEAEQIMKSYDPIDVRERGNRYREEGWTSYDPKAPGYTQTQIEAEKDRYKTTLR